MNKLENNELEENIVESEEQYLDEEKVEEEQINLDEGIIDDIDKEFNNTQKCERKEAKVKESKKIKLPLLLCLVGFSCGICGSIIGSTLTYNTLSTKLDAELNEITIQKNIVNLVENEETYKLSDIVSKTMPSVVAITNYSTQTLQYMFNYQQVEVQSAGSGVIIGQKDNELLIVTNYHVVEGSNELYVNFSTDNTENISVIDADENKTGVIANIKGADPDCDIAIISIKLADIDKNTLSQIAIANIGNSELLNVGDDVIAIGNACGYGQSVTTGIVSALNKSITVDNTIYNNLIQTDAAINPGNSGGALFNSKGELIGINSAKMAASGVEGMGYSISISSITDILDELSSLETKEKVAENERGYLGISGLDVDTTVSKSYNMPQGVYVSEISSQSELINSELKCGDIITRLEKQKVTSMTELQKMLTYYSKGEIVTLTIYRANDGEYIEKEIQVKLSSKEALNALTN